MLIQKRRGEYNAVDVQRPGRSCTVVIVVLCLTILGLIIGLAVVSKKRSSCSDSSQRNDGASFPASWLRVAAISDVHLDILYKSNATSLVSQGFPCHNDSARATFLAPYGRVNCDSPEDLLNSALDAMATVDQNDMADIFLVTGDNSAHNLYTDRPNGTSFNGTVVLAAQKTFTETFSRKFPNRRVLLAVGNNDVPSHWEVPESWWYESLWEAWGPLILCRKCPPDRFNNGRSIDEAEFNATFLKGAYYKVRVTPQLDFLVLNTLYWSSYAWQTTQKSKNWHMPEVQAIADDQMAWLQQSMDDASKNGRKVVLIGHVPPGMDPQRKIKGTKISVYQQWITNYTNLYLQYLQTYEASLAGQIFAHFHKDDFRILAGSSMETQPALLMPAVSPVYENNPAFRWIYFSVESNNWQLADYTQYWGDLVQGNVHGKMSWAKDYTFTEAYPSSSERGITGQRLVTLWEDILQNDNSWQKFKLHHQVHFANLLQSYSRYHLYCAAQSPTLTAYTTCRKKYPYDPGHKYKEF